MKKFMMVMAVVIMASALTGCMRPYVVPEYLEINTNQTAFVVPLDAGNNQQGKLDSVKAYEDKKVAIKRILIEKRWLQTNREWIFNHGEYIPTVRVFVVDRSPQARHWTMSKDTGTTQANQAFCLQSKEGVRFFVDYNCTGNILEEDAAKFLYFYPYASDPNQQADQNNPEANAYFTSLATVMDSEVWAMVQVFSSEFAALSSMEELKAKKAEMNIYVRDKVVIFFKTRGINITTLGIAGDFSYADDKVQQAINDIFVAQQQLNVEQATLNSMPNKIARMTAEGISAANQVYQGAIGEAEAIKNMASGESAQIINKAQGQAQAISAVAKACLEATNNPLFLPTKELQIESARIAKWKAGVPQVMLDGQNQPTNFINIKDFMAPSQQAVATPEPPK